MKKLSILILAWFLVTPIFAEDEIQRSDITEFNDYNIQVLNDNLRRTTRRMQKITSNGVEQFETPTDDSVIVGNGTTFDTKTIPDCDTESTDKLMYDQATNAFSCGVDQKVSTVNRGFLMFSFHEYPMDTNESEAIWSSSNSSYEDKFTFYIWKDADMDEMTIIVRMANDSDTSGGGYQLTCGSSTLSIATTSNHNVYRNYSNTIDISGETDDAILTCTVAIKTDSVGGHTLGLDSTYGFATQ